MGLLVAYYLLTRGVFQGKASGDGWFGFGYLRALVYFHTLDMRHATPEFLPFFGLSGPGHHMPNRCPFGPVFVWLPLYLVSLPLNALVAWLASLTAHAQALAPLTRGLRAASSGSGNSQLEAYVTALGTLAGVLVGWRYTYVLVERHCGRAAARLGSIAAVWATPIAWYAVTQPFYQHGLAFAFVAVLVERWDATRGGGEAASWRRMLCLGLVGGAAMTMREQEALWLLLPGVEAAWHVLRGPARGRWLVGGLVLTGAALVAFVPQMLVWWYYTGSPLHPAQVEPLRLSTPFVVVSLFSTRGGLLPWSPVAYAALVGLAFSRRARVTTWALVAVFALEVYVVSSAWVVTGGYGYGARRLSDGAPLLALALGLLCVRVERITWARRALAGFVALCIGMNVVTMELLRAKKIPSSGAYARSAERFLDDLHAPRPLARLFGVIGYPFVQPAGWLFALRWHVPVTTFEGVVGNWFLDRDGQWFQVQSKTLPLDDRARAYAVAGLELGKVAPATVTGPVRLLLPMFASEPIVVHLVGNVSNTASGRARWNGAEVPLAPDAHGVALHVPAALVRAGVNELGLELPAGARLDRLDFDSTTQWWLKK